MSDVVSTELGQGKRNWAKLCGCVGEVCHTKYVPHEHITVDEAMVSFKGHSGYKQFMKDKPVKFGIKLWVSADAVTANCYNLDVYMDKHGQQVNRLMGLSA